MEKFSLERVSLLKREKNYVALFLYCQKYAQRKEKQAILVLSQCYGHGWGVEKSELHARMLHHTLAQMDDVDGYVQLAWDYYEGSGGRQSVRKAFQNFFQAATKGSLDAKFNLGIFYHNGIGVDRNDVKAKHWFEQAAVLGHARAQFNLGICYKEGMGCRVDLVKARYWLEQASDQGYTLASDCLESGHSIYVLKELQEIRDRIKELQAYIDEPMDIDEMVDSIERRLEQLKEVSHGKR